MNGAGSITSSVLSGIGQAQSAQVQQAAELNPEAASAISTGTAIAEMQMSLFKSLLSFEGNAVQQLLAPLEGLGQNADFRV
jgi:hypothetical protein